MSCATCDSPCKEGKCWACMQQQHDSDNDESDTHQIAASLESVTIHQAIVATPKSALASHRAKIETTPEFFAARSSRVAPPALPIARATDNEPSESKSQPSQPAHDTTTENETKSQREQDLVTKQQPMLLAPNGTMWRTCECCGIKSRAAMCFGCKQKKRLEQRQQPPPTKTSTDASTSSSTNTNKATQDGDGWTTVRKDDGWITVARAKTSSSKRASHNGLCVKCLDMSKTAHCDKCKVIHKALQDGHSQEIAEQLAYEARFSEQPCASCPNMIPAKFKFCAVCRNSYRNEPRPCKRCDVIFIGGTYCAPCTEALRKEFDVCHDCEKRTPELGSRFCRPCKQKFQQKDKERVCKCGQTTQNGMAFCKACVLAYRRTKNREA